MAKILTSTELLFYRTEEALLALHVRQSIDLPDIWAPQAISNIVIRVVKNPKEWPTQQGLWIFEVVRLDDGSWSMVQCRRLSIREVADVQDGSWRPKVSGIPIETPVSSCPGSDRCDNPDCKQCEGWDE